MNTQNREADMKIAFLKVESIYFTALTYGSLMLSLILKYQDNISESEVLRRYLSYTLKAELN